MSAKDCRSRAFSRVFDQWLSAIPFSPSLWREDCQMQEGWSSEGRRKEEGRREAIPTNEKHDTKRGNGQSTSSPSPSSWVWLATANINKNHLSHDLPNRYRRYRRTCRLDKERLVIFHEGGSESENHSETNPGLDNTSNRILCQIQQQQTRITTTSMVKQLTFETSHTNMAEDLEVPLRSFKRPMRPRLSRKLTSVARINLNRFWNELEDFYSRFDDRRFQDHVQHLSDQSMERLEVVSYTTDGFDHERETAENRLNELLEQQWLEEQRVNQSPIKMQLPGSRDILPLPPKTPLGRFRLESYDVPDEETCSLGSSSSSSASNSSSSSRCSSPVAFWNVFDTQPAFVLDEQDDERVPLPKPPNTLIDLASLMKKSGF